MKSPRSVRYIAVVVGALCIAFSSAEAQQNSGSTVTALSGASVVPRLVSFSGVLNDASGKPISNISGVTFLIYRDEQGGAPLWLETQNVTPDKAGHYSVQLGATRSDGLPADMFLSGEARWLAVHVAGDVEKPRVLLVAVPYAMKAADAETIGGLPPSAFVLAAPAASVSTAAIPDGALASVSSPNAAPTALSVTTTGGTLNALPLWTTSTNIQSSTVSQTGTGSTAKIGIGTTTPGATLDVKGGANIQGLLTAAATGIATSVGGKNSQPHAFVASSFNSSTLAAVNQTFQWKAEAAGNNTSAPSGTLNLQFGSGITTPVETGLKLSNKGIFTFAAGQTFPGTGTLAGITTAAGSGLTGGGTSGTLSLSLLKTCSTNQLMQWNGASWVCATISGSGSGTVTSVGTGTGLTGGPITTTGTISIASGGVGTAQIANAAITNPLLASAAVKAGNLSASGSSTGQVLTSNGSSVIWQAPPPVPDPLNLSQSSGNSTISATNNGTGNALYAQSGGANAPTIYAFATGSESAVYGQAQVAGFAGVEGHGQAGVLGVSPGSGVGVAGQGTNGSEGTSGISDSGYGVEGDSNSSVAVAGFSSSYYGVYGEGDTSSGIGVIGVSDSGVGVYGSSGSSYSGAFAGDVLVSGNLAVDGTKNFKIDHPLDPANKYLVHAAIESSEVLNLYSGNVTTDAQGDAIVALPDWFEALSKDFRYQLTVIGQFAQAIVSNKISGHRFSIRTDKPNVEVSWQVTGVRQDAYMKAHPMAVEIDKSEKERGHYLYPEGFGQSREEGIIFLQHPSPKKRLQDEKKGLDWLTHSPVQQ